MRAVTVIKVLIYGGLSIAEIKLLMLVWLSVMWSTAVEIVSREQSRESGWVAVVVATKCCWLQGHGQVL